MASEERQMNEDDDKLGIPEHLLDNPHCEKQLDLQNATELKRKEGNMPWEETASEYFATFLKEFPTQKEEIEKCISCLQEITSTMDRIHKSCTTASLVSNSTSAASGILTILGLTLAPITAGGSLILTATGIGVGAVATVIGLSASLYENIINSKEKKKAWRLMMECEKSLGKVVHLDNRDSSNDLAPDNGVMGENVKQLVSNISGQIFDVYKTAKGIKTNGKVWKIIQARPSLKALAKQSAAAGSSSQGTLRESKYIKNAFAGSTLAMSKGARLLSAVSAGLFLLIDAYALLLDAKHLVKGAKAETAAEIRGKASKFEEELWNLSKLYDELKDLA